MVLEAALVPDRPRRVVQAVHSKKFFVFGGIRGRHLSPSRPVPVLDQYGRIVARVVMPTAHTSVLEIMVTPLNLLCPGTGSTETWDQADPFQCSASGCTGPN